MALFDSLKPVRALTELLEKEHAAILKAEFAALAQVSALKMSLMKSVAKSSATSAELETLKSLTERNWLPPHRVSNRHENDSQCCAPPDQRFRPTDHQGQCLTLEISH